jgi:hypothetical protein
MTEPGVAQPLHAQLSASAWESARDAMKHYSEVNLRRFCTEAAHSIEMGGKALLCKISPVLIADPKHVDSQLYLADHPSARPHHKAAIRTISCREVIDRLSRILPTLKATEITPIIDARDGATHYLIGDREALERMVLPFLSVMRLVQKELDASDADVFGNYAELVNSLREVHGKKVDRTVAAKLARAKQFFAEHYGELPGVTRAQIVEAIRTSYILRQYDEQAVQCPACHQDVAIVAGQHEFQRWEADFDEDGSGNAYPVVSLFANELRCGVCRLHLESVDELTAAGLETELDVEDVRSEDFGDWDEEYSERDYSDYAERDYADYGREYSDHYPES